MTIQHEASRRIALARALPKRFAPLQERLALRRLPRATLVRAVTSAILALTR